MARPAHSEGTSATCHIVHTVPGAPASSFAFPTAPSAFIKLAVVDVVVIALRKIFPVRGKV